MKPPIMFKMGIDLLMTILLLCQMAYMLIGETAHEWMSTIMFLLFILHHILNWRWYKNLTKGKYSALRIFQTAVNCLVLLAMIGLMISGIMMSRTVFAFLPVQGGMNFARNLHMLAAYWGFILMSIHLGLHWGMVMGIFRKMNGITTPSPARTFLLRGLAIVVCIIGIYAFVKNNIADYLFLCSQFVFFDIQQPLILFFGEYLAMMGLWSCLAYYLAKVLQMHKKRSAEKSRPQ